MNTPNAPVTDPAAIGQYCINCCKLTDNLIRFDCIFYSDWTLSQYRRYLTADPSLCPFVHPGVFPTVYAAKITASAATLDPRDCDYRTGRLIAEALRLIVEETPFAPIQINRRHLLARLYPTDVPVVQLRQNYGEANAVAAFSILCIHLAQDLLKHPAIADAPYSEFRRQLTALADYDRLAVAPDPFKLPSVLAGTNRVPFPKSVCYEAIQLAYKYLQANDSPAPVATIQNAIASLSQILAASPAFPDLSEYLEHYFAKNGTARKPAPTTAAAIKRQWADKSQIMIVRSGTNKPGGKVSDPAMRLIGPDFLSSPRGLDDATQQILRSMCSLKTDDADETSTKNRSGHSQAQASSPNPQSQVIRLPHAAATTANTPGPSTPHGTTTPQLTSAVAVTNQQPTTRTDTPHGSAGMTPAASASNAAAEVRPGRAEKPQSQSLNQPTSSTEAKEERCTKKFRVPRNIVWPDDGTRRSS